jgi:hypothetical protein
MAERTVPDRLKKAFADLSGQLEDAALIAYQGQSAQSLDEARRCRNDLMAALERMRVRLHRLEGRLR